MRQRSTDTHGRGFDPRAIEAVWRKGRVINGYDPATWRTDACGAWIQRLAYGDTTSTYGWEIDHIVPVALGGSDTISNLQPLQWENNRHKGDSYPNWTCAVRAA